MLDWLRSHGGLALWSLGVSVGSLLLAVVLLPVVVGGLPVDYFRHRGRHHVSARHPALALSIEVARNALGLLLVIAGLAMLLLPGQGLLTLVAGLTLMRFPGKFRLECALARRPAVLKMLNWLRARRGQPPFLPPLSE
jgi:hypothetical protein